MNESVQVALRQNTVNIWIGSCMIFSIWVRNRLDASAVDCEIMLFDSVENPLKGAVPFRVKTLAVGGDGELQFTGGRAIKKGLWIGISASPPAGSFNPFPMVASVLGTDTVLIDVAFETPEEKLPKPVDLLPILEKLTIRLESLPSVPVTQQASRPGTTSKPAP